MVTVPLTSPPGGTGAYANGTYTGPWGHEDDGVNGAFDWTLTESASRAPRYDDQLQQWIWKGEATVEWTHVLRWDVCNTEIDPTTVKVSFTPILPFAIP